jgi:hypothetical protein
MAAKIFAFFVWGLRFSYRWAGIASLSVLGGSVPPWRSILPIPIDEPRRAPHASKQSRGLQG